MPKIAKRKKPVAGKFLLRKPPFPSKRCPGCNALIHARKQEHDCGWGMESNPGAEPWERKTEGEVRKLKKIFDDLEDSIQNGQAIEPVGTHRRAALQQQTAHVYEVRDVTEIKALVDKLGMDTLTQLVQVFA